MTPVSSGDLGERAYYQSIYNIQKRTGLGFSFSHISQKQVDQVLRMNWSGKHYSKRIWKNTENLAQTLKEEMLVSLLTGRTVGRQHRSLKTNSGQELSRQGCGENRELLCSR